MTDIFIVLAIIVGIVLIAVIWIEANEYRKYVKAAHGLIALGEAMKVSFEQVGVQMNRFVAVQGLLVEEAENRDTRIRALELVQSAHTEALTIKLFTEFLGSPESKKVQVGTPRDVTGF